MQDYIKSNEYISPEEWRYILDSNIIDGRMKDILEIIYNSENHTISVSKLVRELKNKGFDEKQSYNSVLVHNGKKIKEHLNKVDIYGEDDNIKYWPWFFTGEWLDDEFRFKLRKELVYALKNDDVFNDNLINIQDFDVSSFMEYLKLKGYLFDPNIIENYLLSLKVKPFVIFTGNSGTGKTKLTQLFINFISDNTDLNFIETSVKVGKSAKNGGWSISRTDVDEIFPVLKYENSYPIIVDGIEGEGKFNMNTRLFFSPNEKLVNHLEDLANDDSEQRINLKIILPSFSNNQYELVPVGANWTESRNILGFYNVITGEYEETPAYNLIKDAQEHKKTPYFLILDEMNLSHVERYFADFLSAMESKEPIPISSEESLEIPENLFIVGTVNVDETTYMFSPKVLDRANTIEFKTMSALDYMNSNFENYHLNGDESYLMNPQSDEEIRNANIHELKEILSNVKYQNKLVWDILSEQLEAFQNVLKKANFDFGFRVINEILRFMVVSWKYEKEPENWNNWQRYFDAQIKQKMLPKLHGSQKVLGPVIKELFELCLDEPQNNTIPRLTDVDKDNSKYYTSALKLKEMDINLHNQRYTSFVN